MVEERGTGAERLGAGQAGRWPPALDLHPAVAIARPHAEQPEGPDLAIATPRLAEDRLGVGVGLEQPTDSQRREGRGGEGVEPAHGCVRRPGGATALARPALARDERRLLVRLPAPGSQSDRGASGRAPALPTHAPAVAAPASVGRHARTLRAMAQRTTTDVHGISRFFHAIDAARRPAPSRPPWSWSASWRWSSPSPSSGFQSELEYVFTSIASAITLVMVFAIQHTQRRQQLALQIKLDELLRALPQADDRFVHIEVGSDDELDDLEIRTVEHHDALRRDPEG